MLNGGTRLDWTNLACAVQPNVAVCPKTQPNAQPIDRDRIKFLDRYLKGKPGMVLTRQGRGLSADWLDLE
jgi:hypothetical protein